MSESALEADLPIEMVCAGLYFAHKTA
jgi:hypothetical protein